MKRLIFPLLLLFSTLLCLGQEINVRASFDTSSINIGDQIGFSITIDQPADITLDLPLFKDTLIKNIEILSGPLPDSSIMKDGRVRIVEKYLITSFDSGSYKVPPVFAELKNDQGLKRFYSEYSQLEVMRVKIAPADTTLKIFDIIEPYKARITLGEVLPWILLGLALLMLIWFGARIIRRLKKPEKANEPVVNFEPAHIIAFRELEKLRDENLWQKGELKNYYTRLTEILRTYLENRYRILSLELTTSETLEALVKTGFKKDSSYKLLKTVLNGADLVKFAKYIPETSENESNFQYSWDFILDTKENEVIAAVPIENGKVKEAGL